MDCTIDNTHMIYLLKKLSDTSSTITQTQLVNKVNEKLTELSAKTEKDMLLAEMNSILNCVKSGQKEFTIDKPGPTISDEGITFSITITPNAAGGRRSKARRTKKGTRKGKTAKKRGHRRS